MGTKNLKSCKCGATPIVAKTNKGKWRVMCPTCQKFYTRDHETRDDAVIGWNENIDAIFAKKKKTEKKN